jgi:DNA primase
MPGVDFNLLRAEITMEQVLTLLGFEPSAQCGVQWYGACPLHRSARRRGTRCFSVNVAIGRYYCHGCQSRGNQLELWAAVNKLPMHQAAIELCGRLGCKVPWIRRW